MLSAVVGVLPAFGQPAPVRFDTVASRLVGPGMRYTAIRAPLEPWNIWVLEVDLTHPYLDLEHIKARDRRAGGLERTTAMAARRSVPGRRVVGAINAGFFGGDGAVNSPQVNAGEVVGPMTQANGAYGTVVFTPRHRGAVAALRLAGEAVTRNGRRALSAYNAARAADGLVLYNRFHGSATGTNAFGHELLLRPLDPWTVNGGAVRAVVERAEARVGNMAIPDGRVVLSAHGAAEPLVQGVAVNDTVRLVQTSTPALPAFDVAASGFPVLIQNGVKTTLPQSSHHTTRHPRTALGLNRDTTKLWIVVVDGRTPQSVGMTSWEQQDLFERLGAWNALGLDGGGSSTMVVGGTLVNLPSDGPGTERAVGDALAVVSTAPVGPMRFLSLSPLNSRLFLRGALPIAVSGADEYYAPVPLTSGDVSYEVVPAGLGSVSASGVFTAGSARGAGAVRVRSGSLVDSVRIVVKGIGTVVLTPETAVTDTTRTLRFSARTYDDDRIEQTLPAGEVTFRSLDPSVATVDATGLLRGRREGETKIVATAHGASDTTAVRIVVGTGHRVVDPLDDAAGWTLAPQNLDAASALALADDPRASGGKALRFFYRFTESGTSSPVATLVTDRVLYGVPDTVSALVRSDGGAHRAFYEFVDATGRTFRTSVPRFVNDTAFARMPGPFSRANVTPASIVFPVRFTGIRLELAYVGGRVSGQTYEGAFWIDHVTARYPAQPVSVGDAEAPAAGRAFVGAAPNPTSGRFRVTVTSDRAAPARIVVYDVLGRARTVVHDGPLGAGTHAVEADVSALPGGLYFVHGSGFARPLAVRIVR